MAIDVLKLRLALEAEDDRIPALAVLRDGGMKLRELL
jgi:hypothetical protein